MSSDEIASNDYNKIYYPFGIVINVINKGIVEIDDLSLRPNTLNYQNVLLYVLYT